MRWDRVRIRPVALGLLAVPALCGCGSSAPTASQLRNRATVICDAAGRRLNNIPTPTEPTQGEAFVKRGVVVLSREISALRAMHPPKTFDDALAAKKAELSMLRFTAKGLKAGNDPVVAIKTLQTQLAPVEARDDLAWQQLGIDACVNR